MTLWNGCRIYVDIMKGEKLSSIQLANMVHVYWSASSSSRRGGDEVNGVERGDRYLSPLQVSQYLRT